MQQTLYAYIKYKEYDRIIGPIIQPTIILGA